MFIECVVVDAFSKVPIGLNDFAEFFIPLDYSMAIYDGGENKIYETSATLRNSTASFTYKVPKTASGG
jgi:hypothetical protein